MNITLTRNLLLVTCLFLYGNFCNGQSILLKNISIEVKKQRLDNVLEIISNQGGFYFSYKSNIIKQDTLVTLSVTNKTIKQILDILFNDKLAYVESGNYIILRYKPLKQTSINIIQETKDRWYTITGRVFDEYTGMVVPNASIYEKKRLLSTLTNYNGYFKIKLKAKYKTAAISISKDAYVDTNILIKPKYDQQISIAIIPLESQEQLATIAPSDYILPFSNSIQVNTPIVSKKITHLTSDSFNVEKNKIGNFLLSNKQKNQNLNIKKFFTDRSFQVSLIPGLSTHGSLNTQIANKYSLNVLGGFSAGVKVVEIGGFFNIVKKDVQYAQIAGLFNLVGRNVKGVQATASFNYVGGNVKGMQLSYGYNHVMKNFKGLQACATANFVKGELYGAQIAGFVNITLGNVKGMQLSYSYNHVMKKMSGMQASVTANFIKGELHGTQIAGALNIALSNVKGAQIATLCNYTGKTLEGVQMAGLINKAKKVKGVQIATLLNSVKKIKGVQMGLINIADSVEGVSIGVLNIVRHGYHKLDISTNDVMPINISLKTGTNKLYNIYAFGFEVKNKNSQKYIGIGLGNETILTKRLALNTEITTNYLLFEKDFTSNFLHKLQLNVSVKLSKRLALYAGPGFYIIHIDEESNTESIQKNISKNSIGNIFTINKNNKGWLGFTAGVHMF